jgi:hypothetical protein
MQVEARPQTGQGTSARLVKSIALAHCLLQPGREQGADGGAFLGSENASFPQEIYFNFQRDIGLHGCTHSRVAQVYVLYLGNSSGILLIGWTKISEK